MGRVIVGLLVIAAVGWSCGELRDVEGQACSHGSDCIYPAVCCTEPSLPGIGDPLPLCEEVGSCLAYLPVLLEGNPCHRTTRGPLDDCAEPWVCCPKTLVCSTAEACEAAPPPMAPDAGPIPDGGVAEPQPCAADADCAPGTVCLGISLVDRENGRCAPIPASG